MLTQYVPGAFGARGMNVPFCLWLARLHRDGTDVRVMFHEPFFYFGLSRPWRNVFAVVQRAMAAILSRASTRVYCSTETWTRLLAPYGPQTAVEVLPIPSTIPLDDEVQAEAVAHARRSRGGGFLIGHFGTYGDHIGRELAGAFCPPFCVGCRARECCWSETAARRSRSACRPACAIASTRRGGFRVTRPPPRCARAICWSQPYPDGVTTRRTSMMAALTTSVPVLTTSGALTEPVWAQTAAVALAPAGDRSAMADLVAALAADPVSRAALGARGRALYDAAVRARRHDRADASMTLRHRSGTPRAGVEG